MKKTLKSRINQLPLDIGASHFYPLNAYEGQEFIDLTTADGWDAVRSQPGQLFIPNSREEWEEMCKGISQHDSNSGDVAERVRNISALLREKNLRSELYSFGVGLAALEYQLKISNPEIKVFCSDCGDEVESRLRGVFTECDGVAKFDLKVHRFRDVYPNASADAVVLMNRMDPHLTDTEWKTALAGLAQDGVRHVLFVPHALLTLRYLINMKRSEWSRRLGRVPLSPTGQIRTLKRWRRILGSTYRIVSEPSVGSGHGFWLEV